MKKVTLFISIFLLGLFVSSTVFAADYLPKTKEAGENVVVGGEETFEDLYVGGASVSVNQEILGDLFVGAGSINILGEIEEDLVAAGGNVNLVGPVGDDLRLAGGNVNISAPVGGDLLAAGGTLVISDLTEVGGDMWLAGGVINFSGSVDGEARLAGGEIYLNGSIEGPARIYAEKLTFGPEAVVAGPITYYGKKEAVVLEGAQVGEIDMQEWKGWKNDRAKDVATSAFWGLLILKLLALFITALVLLNLFGEKIDDVVEHSNKRPWAMLGIGLLALIATPIIAIILMTTVIGIYLAILLGALYVFFVAMAGVVTVVYLGHLAEKHLLRMPADRLSWKTILAGVIAGAILALIPVIGWLVLCILFLMVLGAMIRQLRGTIEV